MNITKRMNEQELCSYGYTQNKEMACFELSFNCIHIIINPVLFGHL